MKQSIVIVVLPTILGDALGFFEGDAEGDELGLFDGDELGLFDGAFSVLDQLDFS